MARKPKASKEQKKQDRGGELLAAGQDRDGVAVEYYRVEREFAVLVEVRNEAGERLTHSDSLENLQKHGYKVDKAPDAAPAQ